MAGQTDSPVSGKADLSQLCLGFILMGSLLLSLPFVQQVSSTAGYIDHLFTAVSMVCVTGLFTQSVASTYNGWGN